MHRFSRLFALCLAVGLAVSSAAFAQYRPPPRRETAPPEKDSFSDSVDLERFRKGNIDWDTQELIASGMTALHEEHQRILQELEELQTEIRNLKEGKQ
ncbi:MAG: hypothetical protein HYZ88_03170 [Candidatus Omnitrophica bacterium]|nr:hypothetical protein [Candidatus Omnitrophota bacterium]